jgi:hypothetical protein
MSRLRTLADNNKQVQHILIFSAFLYGGTIIKASEKQGPDGMDNTEQSIGWSG